MQATFWGQFKALMRKNIMLKKRSKRQAIQESLYPIYMVAILIIIKLTTKADTFAEIPSFPEYNVTNNPSFSSSLSSTIFVAPSESDVWTLVNDSVDILATIANVSASNVDIRYFQDENAMVDAYTANSSGVGVGLIFKYNGGPLSQYAIRLPNSDAPDTTDWTRKQSQCRSGKGLDSNNCEANKYLYSGFTILQVAINTALIRTEVNDTSFPAPDVTVQMMPKPTFTPDTSYLQTISSIYFVMAYSPFVNFLTMNLVSEKEKKIKEMMKMMGLKDSAFWLSWLTVYFVIITLVTAVITIITLVSGFFINSNVFIFFLILWLYGLSILTMSCILTPFFDKAQTAGGLAGLFTMVFSCLYLIVSLTRTIEPSGEVIYSISPGVRWLLCIISPVAVALAIDQAIFLDQPLNGGMQFSSMTVGDFPLWAPMLMLLIDFIAYFFIAVYLDTVVPGAFGAKKKPWFCFMKSYWVGKSEDDTGLLGDIEQDEEWEENVEPVSADVRQKTAVRISNICKEFKTKDEVVHAVNGLSLEMYEGQITCLLGHNGAGKTTLMNLLTGMLPTTSGNASILGLDVNNAVDMDRIRTMTGVCPQQNVLFDDLTALEHIMLFGGIKGIPDEQLETEGEKWLKNVDLLKEKNTLSRKLSGGQKRKLSVAIAMIGDPKVIFLDEPTAGMDPFSRRHLWLILKQMKPGRVILLTTHFMDEADILSDRKAVISKGKLRCCGSSLYLKSKFGVGYHLNMVIDPACNPDRVTEVVQGCVEGAELQRIHGKELAYTLPINVVKSFAGLFATLEKASTSDSTVAESLGIKSYGVAMTTLEEVFLRLEADDSDLDIKEVADLGKSVIKPTYGAIQLADKAHCTESVTLNFEDVQEIPVIRDEKELRSVQFWSLCRIRFLRIIRTKVLLVFHLVFPVIFVLIGLLVNKYVQPPKPDTSPVPMNLSIAATHYARPTGGSSSIHPLLIKNSVGTSTKLMDFLKADFVTDTYTFANSSLFRMSSNHDLGMDLKDLTTAANKALRAAVAERYQKEDTPFIDNKMDQVEYKAMIKFLVLKGESAKYIKDRLTAVCGTSPHYLPPLPGYTQHSRQLKNPTKVFAVLSDYGKNISRLIENITSVPAVITDIDVHIDIVTSSAYKALYNDSSIHAIPAIINLVSNALLQTAAEVGSKTVSSEVSTSSLPWPTTNLKYQYSQAAFSSVILLAMAFILVPPGFATDLVKDRQFKVRSQLRVSGITFGMYWMTNFFVDMVKFCIPAVLTFIITLAFQVDSLKNAGAIVSLLLLLIAFMPSTTLFSYVMSFAFSKFESCQAAAMVIYFFLGFLPYLIVSLVDMISSYDTAAIIHYVLCAIIGPYQIFGGIYYIDRVQRLHLYSPQRNEPIPFGDYFTGPIVYSICMCLVHCILWSILLRLLDIRSTGGDKTDAFPCIAKNRKVIPVDNPDVIQDEDDDVTAERQRVLNMSPSNKDIAGLIENLRKEFVKTESAKFKNCQKVPAKDRVKVAVRNATFAVDTGEILGLLGPNGAGKTTTLNMMIAEVGPTKGKVSIGGYDIRSSMSEAFKALGYCPQHDALWDVITVEEHINFYANISGIPKKEVKGIIDFFLDNIKIEEHAKKQSKDLSGGTKRKLSYIMSLLGKPKIVLLDEPSTGMDPKSKRFLWDTITSNISGSDKGAILTTHYMEEADALCSRVAIMVNGKIECIGATQHLKGKFGSGYLLEVKLSLSGSESEDEIEQKMDSLEDHLYTLFPDGSPLERFGERAQYKVPKDNVKSLAQTFSALEEAKVSHGMEEYNFSQSSLEQVFLDFAKKQLDEGENEEDQQGVLRQTSRQMSRQTSRQQAYINEASVV